MSGNTILGSIGSSLTINSATAISAPVTAAAVTVNGALTASGTTVLGSSSGTTSLTVNSAAVFSAPVTVQNGVNLPRGSLLNVSGDAVLGSSQQDRLLVNSATVFTAAVAFEGGVSFLNSTQGSTIPGDTTLGTSAADVLTVNAEAMFMAGVQVDEYLSIYSFLNVDGDTVLGNSSSSDLIVHAAAVFTGPVNAYSGSAVPSQSSTLRFQRRLGTAAVAAGTVLGAVLFTGWDGATEAAGAQIRSVFTVSGAALSSSLACMLAVHKQLYMLSFNFDLCHAGRNWYWQPCCKHDLQYYDSRSIRQPSRLVDHQQHRPGRFCR